MDEPASLEVEVKVEDMLQVQGGRDTSVQIFLNSYGIAATPSPLCMMSLFLNEIPSQQ